MRILVMDGLAMTGRVLLEYLARSTDDELFYTVNPQIHPKEAAMPPGIRLYLSGEDPVRVRQVLEAVRPEVIVNAMGIVGDLARQREIEAYRINGLLPHLLAETAEALGGRLIQISTDSVFSGERGRYEERHVPDGSTVYARTKALGEVHGTPHLTIRTSLVGLDGTEEQFSLLQWFLLQKGTVKGYVGVSWNGVTTLELAKFIRYAIGREPRLSGMVHLASPDTISKFELLELFRHTFAKEDVTIEPHDAIVLHRTLRSTRKDLAYTVPTQAEMLAELRAWLHPLPSDSGMPVPG